MRGRTILSHYELLSFLIFLTSSFISLGFSQSIDEFVGCGGFVEASAALSKVMVVRMDYSNIKIKLFTRDGVLKDSTECAPNGYYYLPIYDKGNFKLVIDGPDGWNFEPNEVDVQIGEDNQCKGGDDINFKLIGFSLTGKVISSGDCESGADGPAGVLVTLKNQQESSSSFRTTTTSRGGKYVFRNVFPGPYSVIASHNSWTFSKFETTTTLNWGNKEVEKELIVSGYDIRGGILADDEPVSGVAFLLYSEKSIPIDCPEVEIAPPDGAKKPQCVTFSDSEGNFAFKNIPCGKYTLVPFYKGDHTTFDVVPAGVKIVVDKGSVILDQTFQVMGFSVIGRVVNQEGGGVEDVIIIVDGHIKALSGSDGFYKLEQVTSGSYDIEASKDHFFLGSLSGHRLSPNVARLPDIHVSSYHLCGRIIIDIPLPGINIKSQREVFLKNEEGKTETRVTDTNGGYCFEVKQGKYSVFPKVSKEEKQGGLLLSPEIVTVQITTKPKLDADFIQSRLTLSGKVTCIESHCDKSVSIVLSSMNRPLPKVSTTLTDGGNVFLFRDVLPGQYHVEVNQDSWCWEQKSFEIDLSEKQTREIVFVQSGYVLTTQVTHDLPLILTHVSDKGSKGTKSSPTKTPTIEKIHLVKGLNKHCLSKGGVYEISTESCYRFGKGIYTYDTSSSGVVDLSVTQYLIQGTIIVEVDAKEPLKNEITIEVKSSGNKKQPKSEILVAPHSNVPTQNNQNEQKTKIRYESTFSYWSYVGEQMEFIPRSNELLFYPKQTSFTLTRPECPAPLPVFQARPGLYLTGSVVPPLEGISISIVIDDGEENKMRTDYGQPLMVVQTEKTGKYRVGPLYDDQTYRVLATKEGFHFKEDRNNKGQFRAQKLGSVSITVFEEFSQSKTAKTHKSPLGGVLLSLTGDDGYRNNSMTQQDGTLVVPNLFPGDYFLRPLLKEYVFNPNFQTITISEGQTAEFSFSAVRVAYSCYGHVHSLNGEAEKFVVVEADAITAEHHEETQSDANGDYRLRGLQPNHEYVIRIKDKKEYKKTNPLQRPSPREVRLAVQNEDIRNVDFVLFRKSPKFDIHGIVNSSVEWYPNLKIELTKVDEEKSFQTLSVGPTNYFDFLSLSKDSHYLLKLTTSLSDRIYDIQISKPLLIVFEEQTQSEEESDVSSMKKVVFNEESLGESIVLNFDAKPKLVNQDIAQTPFFALFFGTLAFLAAVYHKKAIEIVALITNGKWRKIFEKSSDHDDFAISLEHRKVSERKKKR